MSLFYIFHLIHPDRLLYNICYMFALHLPEYIQCLYYIYIHTYINIMYNVLYHVTVKSAFYLGNVPLNAVPLKGGSC